MKKASYFIRKALAGTLALGMTASSLGSVPFAALAEELPKPVYTIQNGDFETGNLDGWTLLDGEVGSVSSDGSFWGARNLYKQGNFSMRGDTIPEAKNGHLRSTTFTLGGEGYIAFLIGSAANVGKGTVQLYEEIEKGEDVLVKSYNNKNWNDPKTALTLLRVYDKLDEEYIGRKFYFVVENGLDEGGFAFINVDDFRTSMTKEEVADLYNEDAARIKGQSDEYAQTVRDLYRNVTFYDTETQVGVGSEARKAKVTASIKAKDIISPGITVKLIDRIQKATKVEDGFGNAVDFAITIKSITLNGEALEEDGSSLTTRTGEYQIRYSIDFLSDGEETSVEKDYAITVEKAPITNQVPNGDFEMGDFSYWTLMDGSPADENTVGNVTDENTYWGSRSYFKQGSYFVAGAPKEGASGGQIRSGSFILGGEGYISFMIGGAANEKKGSVKVYQENENGEDTLIKTYTNPHWSDPKTGNTLIRVFDKLDDQYMGKQLYFVIENGTDTSGFAFINADDFRTSLTASEVKALQEEQLTWLDGQQDEYKDYIISCYRANGIYNDVVLAEDMPESVDRYAGVTVDLKNLILEGTKVIESYSLQEVEFGVEIDSVTFNGEAVEDGFSSLMLQEGVYQVAYTRSYADVTESKTLTINVSAVDTSIKTIENGDFETGDLSGWQVLTEGWATKEDGSYKGVVSAQTFWGEQLTYNQQGDYHLDGWDNGIGEGDPWAVRSSLFTLGGSGFVSFRMGGNAANVRIYKLDGTLIGTYNQNRFNDANFPYQGQDGGSWADMGTYFVDLSDHIGETMYIELHDSKICGGWAHAFFDDVQTYYETAPDVENGYDVTVAPIRGEDGMTHGEIQIPWQLVSSQQVKTSFEESGFDVANSGSKKETVQLESRFKDPVYQDEAVLPSRTDGVSGKALSFDGYSNYASFNEHIMGSQLTVDAYVAPRAFLWDNPNSKREDQMAVTIASSYDTGAKAGFQLGITKHGYLTFRIGTGAEWYTMTSEDGKTVPVYEWSRVTGVFNGETGVMSLYLNGELVGTKKTAKNIELLYSGRPVLIGKGSEDIGNSDYLGKGCFPGLMDEVSITTTALSAAEVKASGIALPELNYEDARVQDEMLANDYYRPAYHAAPPANWMNEPHALFQYKGKWHLFYQGNQSGPFWYNISWGHWISDDMVNWKCLKDAVLPELGSVSPDAIWTGNVIYTSDGEPLLLITAGDDARTVNGSNQHVGLVRCVDYNDPDLTEWKIMGYAMAQTSEMGKAGEFRDAQCFGIGEDRYMVVGGAAQTENGQQGVAHVFKTKAATLAEWEAAVADKALNGMAWEYMGSLFGDFYKSNDYKQAYGDVWEMPNLAPLKDAEGNDTGKYLFVFSPQHGDNDVWYYIGEFNPETCRFTPDYADAQLMDYGDNIFTGPTVFVNPNDGKVYVCSVMQDGRGGQDHMDAGWAFYAGLPRELYLKADGTLGIKSVDTASVEGETLISFQDLTIEEANKLLTYVKGDTLKIDFSFNGSASEVGFNLKKDDKSAARFFVNETAMGLDKKSGSYTKGETVSGTIYVDKASVEAFVDECKTVSGVKFIRGTGLEVFAEGDVTCSVTVKAMNTIHGTTTYAEVTDHKIAAGEGVAATCTEDGMTAGYYCTDCGEVLVEQRVIPAKGHNSVTDEAVAATCTEDGLTVGSHCADCGEILVKQEVVPAEGHKAVTDKAVAATCTKTGLTAGSHCSVCKTVIKKQTVVAKKAHTYTKKVVKPTYAAQGYTLNTCSVCKATKKTNYTAKLVVAKPVLSKVKNVKGKKLTASWKKNTKATGYEVQISTDKSFKKSVTKKVIKKNKTVSNTFTKLTKGKKYYVRVRSYVTQSKKNYYSAWSNTLNVKISK